MTLLPLKSKWDQRLNYIKNLSKQLLKLFGIGWKTLVMLALLIYWAIILLAPFFTVELKVTKSNKVRFSPHQIAFHVKHPHNTFILAEALGPRAANRFQMFRGSRILELVACGLKLDACSLGLDACNLFFNELGA